MVQETLLRSIPEGKCCFASLHQHPQCQRVSRGALSLLTWENTMKAARAHHWQVRACYAVPQARCLHMPCSSQQR